MTGDSVLGLLLLLPLECEGCLVMEVGAPPWPGLPPSGPWRWASAPASTRSSSGESTTSMDSDLLLFTVGQEGTDGRTREGSEGRGGSSGENQGYLTIRG